MVWETVRRQQRWRVIRALRCQWDTCLDCRWAFRSLGAHGARVSCSGWLLHLNRRREPGEDRGFGKAQWSVRSVDEKSEGRKTNEDEDVKKIEIVALCGFVLST